MSTTSSSTKYTFYIQIQNASGLDIQTGMEIDAGLTDSAAFELRDAILGVAWTSGMTVNVQVTKQDFTGTSYTTNLTSPPSFT
jgi:hypothetical protein